jgi:hypothetical protein
MVYTSVLWFGAGGFGKEEDTNCMKYVARGWGVHYCLHATETAFEFLLPSILSNIEFLLPSILHGVKV